MVTEGPPRGEDGLDHVGVEGALHQESDLAVHRQGFFGEHLDELVTDDPALQFRVGHAVQPGQETLARVDHPEIDAQMPPKGLLHLLALMQPE